MKAINISKKINGKQIFKNINLEIKKGEILAITGANGSGKTTLLRCLTFLEKIDSGKIILDNKKIYPKISIVFQQLFLWPHLTNRENIILAVKDKNYNKNLDKLIKDFDMYDFIDNYPNQSSVGQKQRVAIARTLILKPEYIFFDEITSSLDKKQKNKIIEIIKNLKKKNIGIFFITHDENIINKIADKVLDMDEF